MQVNDQNHHRKLGFAEMRYGHMMGRVKTKELHNGVAASMRQCNDGLQEASKGQIVEVAVTNPFRDPQFLTIAARPFKWVREFLSPFFPRLKPQNTGMSIIHVEDATNPDLYKKAVMGAINPTQ